MMRGLFSTPPLHAILLTLMCSVPARAQTASADPVQDSPAHRDTSRYRNAGMVITARRGTPIVDGVVSEGEWSRAVSLSGFTQFQPDPEIPSSEHTEARVLYDQDCLYLAFRCEQDQAPIQDYVTRRDHLPGDPDWVGIVVDPFLTWKEAYLFCVNPEGVQMDGMIGPQGNGDLSWDGLWKSAARIGEEDWTVEIAIPWKTLRFPRKASQRWGINLVRSVGERGEMATWAPIDIGSNNILAANALLEGISGVRPGHALWINPYATLRAAREIRELAGEEVEQDWSSRQGLEYMGVDVRAGLGSNLVLDLTLNPDFGHIEADQEQVNFSPYELFFEEKRPFFLEGQKIFEMPVDLFYSRRIHNPLAGAKLTGQVGSTQIGVISAWDEPLGDLDPFPERAQSVLRLKQDIGTASYVGAVLTSQDIPSQGDLGGGFQRNAGLDIDLRPSDRLRLAGMGAVADAPGIGADAALFHLESSYTSRTWNGMLAFTDAGRDFDAFMGYLPRPGQQHLNGEGGYRIEADWGPVKWIVPGAGFERWQHPGGGLIEQGGGFGLNFQFRTRDNLNLRAGRWEVREGGIVYGGRDLNLQYSANRSGSMTGHAGINLGEGFDYGGFDQIGDERVLANLSLRGGVTWRPTVRASFSLTGNAVRRSLHHGSAAIDEVGILRLAGQYQLTRSLFGRLNLQVRRDHLGQDVDGGEQDRSVLLNALLGCELGPGRVFYLAYNHYDLGRDPFVGEADRVLFLKVAHLFTS